MIPRPPQFDVEHARRWHDPDAAESYRYRYPYPAELFDILLSLAGDEPRAVLDVGCGTGNIARLLAPRVQRVDAVDFAAAMVAVGKRLPGGDHGNIRWQVGRAEDAELLPPYSLIVGGQSLHWMNWEVVLPRFAEALVRGGKLAVVAVREADAQPWDREVRAVVDRYSTYKEYIPFDMLSAWENSGLFRQEGERLTEPVRFEQPIEEFIGSFHATSNLTRAHIDSDAFDREIRALMQDRCPGGVVARPIRGHVVWGLPGKPPKASQVPG